MPVGRIALGLWLASFLFAAGATAMPSTARAAAPASDAGGEEACTTATGNPLRIRVQTAPPLAGFRFAIGPIAYRTGAAGAVDILVPSECELARIRPLEERVPLGSDVAAVFRRWHSGGKPVNGSSGVQRVRTATFDVEYATTLDFRDPGGDPVPAERIDRVVLKSATGMVRQIEPGKTAWLQGTRMIPEPEGFSERQTYWTVERVEASGSNVVNRSQIKFFPSTTRRLHVPVLFHQVTYRVRDALFGFPLGETVELRYPDGSVRASGLSAGDRSVTFAGLPRGDYRVRAHGRGLLLSQQVSVSRDQVVDLKLVSWFDVGVMGAAAILLAVELIALGQHLSARAAATLPSAEGHRTPPSDGSTEIAR